MVAKNQKERFLSYLENNTATSSMASEALNIPQKNLTRYKSELQDEGKLKEVCKTFCRLTGYRAAYLTTNPLLIEQLNKSQSDGRGN